MSMNRVFGLKFAIVNIAFSCSTLLAQNFGNQIAGAQAVVSQSSEELIVQSSATVLAEAMQTPGNRIPQAMLSDAHGVAIIPNVVKGSFIVGARHGRGLLFVREPDGVWHAPVFITLTGGNIGWQVGVQSSDLVLVFKTARSIQGLLSGKLTLGADASAAAGPVGRKTGVATDGKLQAEIYTYSRSRGLFAGVSIDGSVVQVDQFATGSYYPSVAQGGPVTVPPSAGQLTLAIATYAGHAAPQVPTDSNMQPVGTDEMPVGASSSPNVGLVQQSAARESEVLRAQITEISPRLYQLLDDQWTQYLALPLSMLRGQDPTPAELQSTLQRFDEVSKNPQYRELAGRPEFRSLDALLRHYQQSLAESAGELRLPPPPKL